MDERTRTALEASIAHWRENAAAAHPDDADLSCAACALCRMFRDRVCRGCPVATRAGAMGCAKTPYEDAKAAWNRWMFALPGEDEAERAAFRDAATREVEFLESLHDDAAWVVGPFENGNR